MLVRHACQEFLAHCAQERGLARNTLCAYRQDLSELNSRFGKVMTHHVAPADLTAYAAFLSAERGLAPATVKRRLACARTMFAWLSRRGIVPENPFLRAEIRVRLPDRLPRCLEGGDAGRLITAARSSGCAPGLAIRLLLETGARVSEVTSLLTGDVNLDGGTLRIIGKGDRQRVGYLTNGELAADVAAYVGRRHAEAGRSGALFVTPAGRTLRPTDLRRHLRRLADQAGLGRTVTPHMLRHTAATALLEGGVDIRFVQKLLGHRNISTTQIYTHVSDRALREAVRRADICARLAERAA